MDKCTVLLFLCLLAAKTLCGPVRKARDTAADISALQHMQEYIQKTLTELQKASSPLSSTSCPSPAFTDLVGEGQETITKGHLSKFTCSLMNMVQQRLSEDLGHINQIAYDALNRSLDCSLTPVREDLGDMERHEHVMCLLQTMNQRINSVTNSSG